MGFPVPLALKVATKIIGKLLPKKPKAVVEGLIADVIRKNPDIQKELEAERTFMLDYFGRAKHLPLWALCVRVTGRWYVVILFSTFMVAYYSLTGKMPDPWFTKMTGIIIVVLVAGRSVEKIFGKTI